MLLQLLLELGRDDEARALLGEYEGDPTSEWAYTAALLAYREGGDSPAANKALQRALKVNRHIPPYLVAKKRIPPALPDLVTLGGPDEAATYAGTYLNHWRRTPGAAEWLRRRAGIAP